MEIQFNTMILEDAITLGQTDFCKHLIKKGALITPRFLLIASEYTDVINTALKNYIDDDTLRFFVSHAISHDKVNIIKMLEENNKLVSDNNILLQNIVRGNMSIVKYLITKGFDFTSIDSNIIEECISNGKLEMLKFLHSKGVDLHQNNYSAFIHSASYGYLNITDFLVENGADIHANNDKAFYESVKYCNIDIIEYLIGKGVDVNANNGIALINSVVSGCIDSVKLLVKNGANNSDDAIAITKDPAIRNYLLTCGVKSVDRLAIHRPLPKNTVCSVSLDEILIDDKYIICDSNVPHIILKSIYDFGLFHNQLEYCPSCRANINNTIYIC